MKYELINNGKWGKIVFATGQKILLTELEKKEFEIFLDEVAKNG